MNINKILHPGMLNLLLRLNIAVFCFTLCVLVVGYMIKISWAGAFIMVSFTTFVILAFHQGSRLLGYFG